MAYQILPKQSDKARWQIIGQRECTLRCSWLALAQLCMQGGYIKPHPGCPGQQGGPSPCPHPTCSSVSDCCTGGEGGARELVRPSCAARWPTYGGV